MPVVDLGVLDTVIAMVIVILMLSMVVQSVQTFVKKLSKFKSRQIKKSLEKLFAYAGEGTATAQDVLDHFSALGRKTMFGGHAVESISKADLSKVVTSIEGSKLIPEKIREPLSSFFDAVTDVQNGVAALAAIQLDPVIAAKLTETRAKLAPIAAHIAKFDARSLINDVLSLRAIDYSGVGTAIADLQSQIDRAAAANPNDVTLKEAAAAAANLARGFGAAEARFTELVARVRERVATLESWYDTVMLGFEERYSRHMRAWAFGISLLLTIVLNADVFQIYKRLATNDVAKQRVIAQSSMVQQRYLARIETARATNDDATVQELTKQLDNELDEVTLSYPAFGLTPFDYSNSSPWSLVGWVVMAFMLSLGAPFWHDTLESLFGLKNFLRQKGDIKKVEQASGAGLTHT